MTMTVREFLKSMRRFALLSVQQPGTAGAVTSRRSRVVSEPGAGITITAIELTPEEQRRLCTNGVRLPPTNPADRLYTRSECDALIEAERARLLAHVEAFNAAVVAIAEALRARYAIADSRAADVAKLRGAP